MKISDRLLCCGVILILGVAAVPTGNARAAGTISLTTIGAAYTQDFDTLASAGLTNSLDPLTGWYLTETGGGSRDNELYAAEDGTDNTGDTYSFGTDGSDERALGALRSSSLVPLYGASFTNNTGSVIRVLAIAYTGEEWRLGTSGRTDQISFEYNLNATSLSSAGWTSVPALNFITPDVSGTGAKNGNAAGERTALSTTISGLSIPNGASFWIRWSDFNASGSDDGLAVDDFSLTPLTQADLIVNRADDIAPRATGSTCLAPASNDCTLREAVIKANTSPGTTIRFAASLNGTPLTLTRTGDDTNAFAGDLDINASMTIAGNGPDSTIIQAASDASYTGSIGDKVFGVNQGGNYAGLAVAFSDMTIRYGDNTNPVSGSGSHTGGAVAVLQTGTGSSTTFSNCVIEYSRSWNGHGGGLSFDQTGSGSLTLEAVTFDHNETRVDAGGALYIDGPASTVTITNSTFSDNQASSPTSRGGALFYRAQGNSSLTIAGTSFSNNQAGSGGAIHAQTSGANTTVHIQDSEFADNRAAGEDGTLYGDGGALSLSSADVTASPFLLDGLLVSGNSAARNGDGIYVSGSSVILRNSRIVNNADTTQVGLYVNNTAAPVDVTGNWWGCSTGPAAAPCDTAVAAPGASLNYDPWWRNLLISSAGTTLVTNQTSTLTASYLSASNGSPVPAGNLKELAGLPLSWDNSNGQVGNITGVVATLPASGAASATFQATAAGSTRVSAQMDRDNTAGLSSNILDLTVMKANTTTEITSDVPDRSSPGRALRISFRVRADQGITPTAPTGMVTVTDGTVACSVPVQYGSCPLELATGGVKTITATYEGDANFNASPPSAAITLTVGLSPTTTTITRDLPDPSLIGQAVTVGFSVTSSGPGTPTGDVTVSDGSHSCTGSVAAGACTLTLTTSGVHALTAIYAGDLAFQGSTSATENHTVNQASTTTAIKSISPATSVVGEPVRVNFGVSVYAPGTGTPTGDVTVSDGTHTCTGSIAAGFCMITFSSAGGTTLTAKYTGNADFDASMSRAQTHTVTPASTVVRITSDLPDPSVSGTAVPVTYSVTVVSPGAGRPSGDVTISDGMNSCTAPATTGTCFITLRTVGRRMLTASYAGDANFAASTSTPELHTVQEPPAVKRVNSSADSGDGRIVEDEHTNASITRLMVIFNKDMECASPIDADDVRNPANYTVIRGGSAPVTITSVSYDRETFTATLRIHASDSPLPDDRYTLTVHANLHDALGARIGAKFVLHFYVDRGHPHPTSIVTMQNHITLTSRTTVKTRIASIRVTFDEDLNNPGGNGASDDVTNPLNYLLLTPGLNSTFDTSDCSEGPLGDDVYIPTGPVVYENHGGAGPFVATVQLNEGRPLPNGRYRLFICGIGSLADLAGNALNGGRDSQVSFSVLIAGTLMSPRTGFPPGVRTVLSEQPAGKTYIDLGNLWIEIPRLDLKTSISGVRLEEKGWDVTWLDRRAGWLEGTAYPAEIGNAVLAAHGYTADGGAGPFAMLNKLRHGDIVILHSNGFKYIYSVRANLLTSPADTYWLTRDEKQAWLTLITCQQYGEKTQSFRYRRIVRAVLVRVELE